MKTSNIETITFRPPESVGKSLHNKRTSRHSIMPFDDDNEILESCKIGMINPETSFERFFRLNIILLTGLGLFSSNFRLSGSLVNVNTRSVLPVLFVIGQMSFFAICELRAFLQFWNTDSDSAISAFTSLISGALAGFKGFRIWMCQVELREILIQLAILWDKSRFQVNVQQKILKNAERTIYVRSWYLGLVLVTTICYTIRPYLLLLQFKLTHEANETYDYSATVMTASYPFATDTFGKYLACINWEMLNAFCLALYWTASDTLFAQIISHTTIQFQVLHYDLKSIGANNSQIINAKEEEILLRKLFSIVERHSLLVAHCKKVEAVYNPTIFVTMVSTAVTMCFCTLNVQKQVINGNHEEVIKSIGQLITVVGILMISCGYAENLTDQNFQIAQAAYECSWIERCKSFKTNLQIIMMRAQKRYCLSGYGFFQLTLAQITTIVNTTMSYFALLKTLT